VKKAAIVGAIIVIIIGIFVVTTISSMDFSVEDKDSSEKIIVEEPIVEEVIVEEPIVEEVIVEEPIVEEVIVEEPSENEGRNLSVEFTESLKMKTP